MMGISNRQVEAGKEDSRQGIRSCRWVFSFEAGLFELEKKERSKMAELYNIPMVERAPLFQAPLRGGILLSAQHLGMLAFSQGQSLLCREHTALRAN